MPIYLLSKYVPPSHHHTWAYLSQPKHHESNRIANTTPQKTRAADPVFAFAIGTSAALVRIRRDQQEKHPERAGEIGYGDVLATGTNRVRRWWAGEFTGVWMNNEWMTLVWIGFFWESLWLFGHDVYGIPVVLVVFDSTLKHDCYLRRFCLM